MGGPRVAHIALFQDVGELVPGLLVSGTSISW